MKEITVTLRLEDDEADWLQRRWQVYSPAPPHAPLTIDQKVAACVFEKWNAAARDEDTAENKGLWGMKPH